MAATITAGSQFGGAASEAKYIRKINFLCDDSYPVGGYPFDLKDYIPTGAELIPSDLIQTGPVTQVAYKAQYDAENEKLKILKVTNNDGAVPTIAEVDDDTDLTDVEFDLLAITG